MERKRKTAVDMLTGSPIKSIFSFGLPILLGSIFQQMYNMVDSIVVGNFVGAGALAAVGSAGSVAHFMLMACMGFTTGGSIVIAQQFGAGQKDGIKATISTTAIFLISLAVVLTSVSIPLAPFIAKLTRIPADILSEAVAYLRIYWSGLIFLMMYNFFAAVLRALGDSVTPLIFLIISSLLNIAGDLWFVVGLGLGVAGVATATVIAQAVSVILCVIYTARKVEYFKFRRGEFVFRKDLFRFVVRMGLPAAFQGSVANLGLIFVQGLVNSFGTTSVAAYAAANKMESFSLLPINCFTQAYAVFVGQNMGAGDVRRTKKGLHQMLIYLGIVSVASSTIIYAIGPKLIGLFVDASETEVISCGTSYMRGFCPGLIACALMLVFASTLRGAGDSILAMLDSMIDLGMRVVAAYVLGLGFGLGVMGCAYAIPCGWGTAAIVAFVRYRSGKWQEKTVVRRQAAVPADASGPAELPEEAEPAENET